jgi:hypothetical protein
MASKQRPDAGQGDWEPLTEAAAGTAVLREKNIGARPINAGPEAATLVPLTFVGERGASSVTAFLELTNVLKEGQFRVSALTASVLGQHAVVNVLAEGPSAGNDELTAGNPLPMDQALEAMFRRKLLASRSWEDGVAEMIPFSVCMGLGPGGGSGPTSRAKDESQSLWIDWELPMHAVPEAELAKMFCTACAALGEVQIRFWRTRTGSDERVRGRAKFAVELQHSAAIAIAGFNVGDRAKAVQSDLLQLPHKRIPAAPPSATFLHVVWSEPWLPSRRGT